MDPSSSVSLREEALEVIALALARQWFGGIVNVNSRNEFWILEGLANYMAVVGANDVSFFQIPGLMSLIHLRIFRWNQSGRS